MSFQITKVEINEADAALNQLIKHIRNGSEDLAISYIKKNGFNKGRALELAASFGRLKIVKALIKTGDDIHYNNEAPLRAAAAYGHIEVVKFLASKNRNASAVHVFKFQTVKIY